MTTWAKMQAEFAAQRKPPLHEVINRIVEEKKKLWKENPEQARKEAREMWIRAGVTTRTGRLTKPFRMMIKRDEEDAARAAAKVAACV